MAAPSQPLAVAHSRGKPPTFGRKPPLSFVRINTRSPKGDRTHFVGDHVVEHHGIFGTIWGSLGMTAYYMAITWINILLGLFLGPLFMIPITWVQDALKK